MITALALATMTWFRVLHVEVNSLEADAASFGKIGVYVDGEWHGASCGDTIPTGYDTTFRIGGTTLIVPKGAWEVHDMRTFVYTETTANMQWEVSVDIDRGAFWVRLQDDVDAPEYHDIALPVEMHINGFSGHEDLTMRMPRDGDALAYYRAGVAPMTCLSLRRLTVERSPRGQDWWASNAHIQGTYNRADCRQAQDLTNVGARLRLGHTTFSVPVNGFKRAAHGWFTYTLQSDRLTWWLSVHPRSGAFWARAWSVTPPQLDKDGGIDVTLQVGDEVGRLHVHPEATPPGFYYDGDVLHQCPTLLTMPQRSRRP